MIWRFWRRKRISPSNDLIQSMRVWRMPNGILLNNIHLRDKCAGRPCVIHAPSDHAQSKFPLIWRNDRGIFERLCPCGIGHPDADQEQFWIESGQEWQLIHGCCGIEGHC